MHFPQQARHTRVCTACRSFPVRASLLTRLSLLLRRSQTLSRALSTFMGGPAAGSRHQDVVKRLWAYIREHGLEARALECREATRHCGKAHSLARVPST